MIPFSKYTNYDRALSMSDNRAIWTTENCGVDLTSMAEKLQNVLTDVQPKFANGVDTINS